MMKLLKKVFKFFLWTTLIVTIINLVIGFITFYYLPSKFYKEAQSTQPYDVIIVPGIPFNGESWSDLMKARVQWSAYLYSKGIAKNIIFSGSAVYTPYVESKVMALYAKELGIKEENIFVETKAEHSTENLFYSYKIAKNKGFETIALATDPFQNFMLWNFIKEVDPKIDMIPIKFGVIKELPEEKIVINAQTAKEENFVSLIERESWSERFRGTLGKNIKQEE